MANPEFVQPRENESDLPHWRKSIHTAVYGKQGEGGTLNGDNITNITDPGDSTDVTDVAVQFNLLLAELRTLGIM